MPDKLSTCAVCGGTIHRVTPPDGGPFWGHVNPALDGHRIDPDDGHVSGPDRSDLPECSGCGHPEHEEGGCEEEVSTGLYGSDGVLVYAFCACTGSVPCLATVTLPVNRRVLHCSAPGRHADGEHVFDAGEEETVHLAFRSTIHGEEGLVCSCGSAHAPDPWTDPDAAAAATPPPF